MWKKSLAMIVIGSLVAGSSFATPLNVKKMLMKDHMKKTPLVSHKHGQNQSKFSGTWAGVCSYEGQNNEIKIRISDEDTELTVVDLMDEENVETIPFNVIKSETNSDEDSYDSFTSRLTRVDENNLKLEGTGMFGQQGSHAKKQIGIVSGVFTERYAVNNNQLTIDMNGKVLTDGVDLSFESKCTLNRAQ